MPLNSGTRLGPYEILAPLGAGGMGEVYRARDTRLGRDVALKILPSEVANDPVRRQRFELEARAVAALNHPNIVAVYDVGDGYIVSELVDGQPLRGSKLGLRKTIDVSVQMASGLAVAHSAGIVHRDLKPDNVLLTRDGRVKILDFGLAKMQMPHAAADADTVTARTGPGVVLGTAGYMSPEQVRGGETDHRSDLFSFGLILYELLSGERAFRGDTAVETMTAILKQDAAELPDTVPPFVRQIVERCLEKDPANRFQSSQDLGFALTQTRTQAVVAADVQRRGWTKWAALAAAIALGLSAGIYLGGGAPAAVPWSGVMLSGTEVGVGPRLAPDGHTLAFATIERCVPQVAIMKPETGNVAILTHSTENGYVQSLCWSADGARIYYDRWTDIPRGIYSVPALGGPERLEVEDGSSPEALPDGSLLLARFNPKRQVQAFRFRTDTGQ